MAIEVFQGSTVPRDIATPGMEFMFAKWRTLSGTGALTLQRLLDEAANDIRERCHLLTPAGDDFSYVYIGAAMLDAIQPGPTGTVLSRGTPLAREFAEIYRRVLRDQTPVFTRFTGRRSAPGTIWHQLVMPVKTSPFSTMIACYSELISHQIEIYEHLFRTASDAMAVASPITNDAGHVTDGWVLMMNDRAREVLGYGGPLSNLRLSSLQQFNGIDLWGRIYAPRPSTKAQIVTAGELEIEILRFPHVFGLRLKPKVATSPPLAPALSEPVSV
jgi:PAS domain-containing protein